MDTVFNSTITIMIILLIFVMCLSVIMLVLEDNRLDPIDTFLINQVSLAGGLTPEVLTNFEVAVQVMGKKGEDFDFSGSTFEPVEHGQDAVVRYKYTVNTDQRPLEASGIEKIESVNKEFIVKRTGR